METGEEIDMIERSQQTLSVAAPEAKITIDAARYEGEVFEEANDVTTLTGGFSLALSANDPLDTPRETVSDVNNDGQSQIQVADLTLRVDSVG